MAVVGLIGVGKLAKIDLMIDGNEHLEVIQDQDGGSTWLDIGDADDIVVPGNSGSKACQLYFAGHTPHWIQSKQSLGEPDRIGRLVAVEENIIAIDYFSEIKYFANHDVERLVEIIGIGGSVSVVERFVILRGGVTCFSIQEADEPWIECDYSPLTSTTFDALAERLRTHGGYTVPGQELVRQLKK
jgi:hypothetical protein